MAEKKKNTQAEEKVDKILNDIENGESKEIESLKAKLQEQTNKAEEFKDKWMRSVAEFDNYKKRNANLYKEAFNDGLINVITKVLFVGDNLDYAISMDLDQKTHDGLVNIKKKYDEVLASMDVTEINPVGEEFNPEIAEAVMQAQAEEGDTPDMVKQVFQKGYKLKDKIIRYAKVSVVK